MRTLWGWKWDSAAFFSLLAGEKGSGDAARRALASSGASTMACFRRGTFSRSGPVGYFAWIVLTIPTALVSRSRRAAAAPEP